MLKNIILLLLILNCVYSQRISIVGAGIGSAACSYYLDKLGNITEVDVFDSNDYIGGRVKETFFGGEMVELGADAWSVVNFYMQSIVKDLNISAKCSSDSNEYLNFRSFTQSKAYSKDNNFGIWNGKFIEWKKILLENLDIHYCMQDQISKFVNHIEINYSQRNVSAPFNTIEEFLSYGNLDNYTKLEFRHLLWHCNCTLDYMNSLIDPNIRVIYDQNTNIQSFAGEVSFVALAVPYCFNPDGNSVVPKRMLEHSKANINLSTNITEIYWNGIQYELKSKDGIVSIADYVVIAAPMEKTNIIFSNITFDFPVKTRSFTHWYVTYVLASAVNPDYFNMTKGSVAPDHVHTTSLSKLPFVSLGSYGYSKSRPDLKIYKLFSNIDVTDQLDSIFIDSGESLVHHWEYTFPNLEKTLTYQPLKLSQGLYYLNSIESVASAMEMSVTSGRNAAQLILEDLYG